MIRILVAALVLTSCLCNGNPSALAHYHILTLDKASIDKDQAVTGTLRFGLPFAHQMFAAQKPTRVGVKLPDGTTIDLTAKLQRRENARPDGKSIVAFDWKYSPALPGDHIITVQT